MKIYYDEDQQDRLEKAGRNVMLNIIRGEVLGCYVEYTESELTQAICDDGMND